MAEYVAIIVDLQKECYEDLIELEKSKYNTIKDIEKIEQPYRNILYLKYIKGKTLTQVAVDIGYEYTYTCELHGTALEEYCKKIIIPRNPIESQD